MARKASTGTLKNIRMLLLGSGVGFLGTGIGMQIEAWVSESGKMPIYAAAVFAWFPLMAAWVTGKMITDRKGR